MALKAKNDKANRREEIAKKYGIARPERINLDKAEAYLRSSQYNIDIFLDALAQERMGRRL